MGLYVGFPESAASDDGWVKATFMILLLWVVGDASLFLGDELST